jgi:hypothetical protein
VILLAPVGADQELMNELGDLLGELAGQSGLRFEVRQTLSLADVQKTPLKVVVALLPDPGITSLVAAASQTQFLAIGYSGLKPAQNLTLLTLAARPDMKGFLAGYIAAVVTADWRVGVVSEADSVEGKTARQAFANGVYYFCGLCRSVYPPYPIPGYPLHMELVSGAGQADWDAVIAYFKEWQVQTVYVPSLLDIEPLLRALSQAGFNLIADQPPPAGLQMKWVASIRSGDLIREVTNLWPELVSGQGEATINLSISITDANPDLFSPGRQKLINEMLADLLGGFIDTGFDSTNGIPP